MQNEWRLTTELSPGVAAQGQQVYYLSLFIAFF